MTLIEQIRKEFTEAYKSQKMEKKNVIGLLKGEIEREHGREPSDEDVIGKFKSMIKAHNKSMKEYDAPSLSDLELEVINSYLPAQMGDDEVRKIVQETVNQTGASGPQDIGKVMGPIMGKLKGKADGKLVKGIVQEILS